MKKGFTLTELLGVIVILGILSLLTFPSVINQIRKARTTITSAQQTLIISAAESYISARPNEYPLDTYPHTYCLTINTLVKAGLLESPVTYADGTEITDQVAMVVVGANRNTTITIVNNDDCSG